MTPRIPVWAYIVGIAMIVFGLFGLTGNIEDMFTPEILDVQQDIMDGISEEDSDLDKVWDDVVKDLREETDSLLADSTNSDLSEKEVQDLQKLEEFMTEEVPEMFENMLSVSEFAKVWLKRFALIGIFISLLYMASGIFLMVIRRFSIPLAVSTLILSLVVSIAKIAVFLSDGESGWIIKATLFGEVFSILTDVAFLLVILLASREAFRTAEVESVLEP